VFARHVLMRGSGQAISGLITKLLPGRPGDVLRSRHNGPAPTGPRLWPLQRSLKSGLKKEKRRRRSPGGSVAAQCCGGSTRLWRSLRFSHHHSASDPVRPQGGAGQGACCV